MLDFLPQYIKNSLKNLNISHVYEIRMRRNKPITINYLGAYRYLGLMGLTEHKEKALTCTAEDISDVVYRAGRYSVYSVEEHIKKGFITAENGERIGIAGEYVFERGQPLTIRDFTSLCIRVPHEVVGCGGYIYQQCMSDKVRSVLIMSPPGMGKTTILRDLSRILAEKTRKNILICDERGEISNGNVGDSCDVVRFLDKNTAFEAGIRALRPEIIVTDELSANDCPALEKAKSAGITIIASAHFSEMVEVTPVFRGLFERFVLLDRQIIGKIFKIYSQSEQ
jgi:stage III sporulation protein AA